jgi:hypothetical protein
MNSQKMLSLVVAAGALAVMGIVTVTMSSPDNAGGNAVFVADTTTQTTPPAAPVIASAGPKVKPTAFVGGDWPGMGSFGEDWAK